MINNKIQNTVKIQYQFNLMSHDYRALEAAVTLYKESFQSQNLKLKGPVFLPKKEKNIVLLRSPHVNKASREIFKFKEYKTILILKLVQTPNKEIINLDLFLKRMCLLDIAGVSIQIIKKL
jgi:small subunit ribosomal protein S10